MSASSKLSLLKKTNKQTKNKTKTKALKSYSKYTYLISNLLEALLKLFVEYICTIYLSSLLNVAQVVERNDHLSSSPGK